MKKNNMRFLSYTAVSILSATLLLNGQPTHAASTDKTCAQAFFGTAALSWVFNKNIANLSAAQWIAKTTHTDAKGLVNSASLASALWATSYLVNKDAKTALRCAAVLAPLMQIVSTSKWYNAVLRKMPLLNRLSCSNKKCTSFCTDCKDTKVFSAIPLGLAAFSAYYAFNTYNQNVHPAPNNINVNNVNDECPICLEEMNTPEHRRTPICRNDQRHHHYVCAECAPVISRQALCPICQQPIR